MLTSTSWASPGIDPKTGLTTGDFEEAAVKRALSRAAAENHCACFSGEAERGFRL